MIDQPPAPLVPPEVDLREFVFMPLDVLRLRDSDLAGTPDAEVFRAAVLSWCVAWHQVPASSLPNDDLALARLLGYGRDVKSWRKIRSSGGLRGWISCSDGRLYHPVVAEKALEAWTRRDAFQSKKHNEETRQQRWRAELARLCDLLRSHGVTPPKHPTKAVLVDLCRLHIPGFVDAPPETQGSTHVDDKRLHVDGGEIGKTGTGQGQDKTGQGHVRGDETRAVSTSERNAEQARAGKPDARMAGADEWRKVESIDPEAMQGWINHRTSKGKPLTPGECIAAAKMLAGMGAPALQRAAVLMASGNGWMNLRPADGRTAAGNATTAPTPRKTADELEAEERARATG